MGWLKMLCNLNNAEGVREAMRMSYEKHFDLARRGQIGSSDDNPHHNAVGGAMWTRMQVRGQATWEHLSYAEALPFMFLDPKEGREAVAEYAVAVERPAEAKIGWLKQMIEKGCRAGQPQEMFRTFFTMAKLNQASWLALVPAEIQDWDFGFDE